VYQAFLLHDRMYVLGGAQISSSHSELYSFSFGTSSLVSISPLGLNLSG
jgi:hypothetical protein